MIDLPFEAVATASPDGLMMLEPVVVEGVAQDFVVRYVNPAGCAITGRRAGELDGRRLLEAAPDHRELGLVERYEAVWTTGHPWFDRVHHRTAGVDVVVEVHVIRVADLIVVRLHDVTVRTSLEEAALRAQEEAATVLESISDAVYVLDPAWRFSYLNPKACELLGRSAEELLGQSAVRAFPDSFGSEIQDHFRRAAEKQVAVAFDAFYPEPLDTWFTVRAYPSAVGLTVYFQDVGSQRRLQQPQARLERVESVAGLAGGVAHDFNNLLMVISGNAAMVEDALADEGFASDMVTASLAAIEAAVARATDLTGQLLRFGQQLLTSPKVLDLDQLIAELLPELRRRLPAGVTLRHEPSQPPLLVEADPTELARALRNVVVNAAEAIDGGGVIVARAELARPPSAALLGGDAPSTAAEVVVTVVDDGPGMPPEVLERSAEPFFTTKGAASTRGMGLAEAHGILRQAGGRLAIESSEAGTMVRFHLPLAEHQGTGPLLGPPAERAASRGATRGSPHLPPFEPPSGEVILVVDDNEEIRHLVARVLRTEGFEVVTAADAVEAVELAQERPAIHLVVTDVMMPGQSGPELAQTLRTLLDPMPPVVYISGYADSAELADDLATGEALLLSKPFEPAALLDAVRRLRPARAEPVPTDGRGASVGD